MVDKSENLKFKSTKLYEFVNMCSGTSILRKYRNNDIEHNIDTDEIMTHNKMKMSIVLPDVNTKTDNYSYIHAKEAGIQIMAMNFQNFDSNLKFYSLFFDSAGYAFALKPEDMRSNTVEIETPESSITLPTTTSYGCPATQEACPDLTNTSDPPDLTDDIVTPVGDVDLRDKISFPNEFDSVFEALRIILLERKEGYISVRKDTKKCKDGIHIMFPFIVIPTYIQLKVREDVYKKAAYIFKEMECKTC